MKYLILLFFLCSPAFGKYADSFIVDVKDRSIKVTSPLKKVDVVSIIVVNHTFDKIISEIRSGKKILKRFVLKPEGKEIVQVDYRAFKSIQYISIAPPFEEVELKFSQRPYEVPEKK